MVNKKITSIDDLSAKDIRSIADLALKFKKSNKSSIQKNSKNIFNLFLEPSTRTTVSFELAAKKLGHNSINIVAGAAGHLQNEDIDKNLDVIKKSKIFLTQMETPDLTTMYALKKAKENNCVTILNPAPARKVAKEDFSLLDFFTPNET